MSSHLPAILKWVFSDLFCTFYHSEQEELILPAPAWEPPELLLPT